MLHNPAPRRPLSTGERIGAFLFSALLIGLFSADLLSPYEPRKLAFPLLLLFWIPALVVHECGHALVAKLVGWRVSEMVLGIGPELMRFQVGETRVVLRALLMEGYILPAPKSPEPARLKSALVYAGGPGAELLVAAAIVLAWGPDTFFAQSDQLPLLAAQSAALALVMGAVMNLIPHAQSGSASDGAGILLSARLPDYHFAYRLAAPAVRAVDEALHAGQPDAALRLAERWAGMHPDNAHLEMLRVRALAAQGDTDAAVAELEALRETAPRNPLVEGELLHTAAQVALSGGDVELLGSAAHAVRSAIKELGPSPTYLATLGALLFELGRHEEAFGFLQLAYKGSRQPVVEDHCIAYLALVTKALDRTEDHRRFAAELKRRGTHAALSARLT